VASIELSEEDLLLRYGGLIWSAVSAFGTDPSYLGDMAAAAGQITYKRALWDARSEAVRQANSPEEVRGLTLEIMASRGVQTPQRGRKAA
jgi:hypothetical protein